MQLMMPHSIFLLACLVCAGHGQQAYHIGERQQSLHHAASKVPSYLHIDEGAKIRFDHVRTLAVLLLTIKSVAAFRLSHPGCAASQSLVLRASSARMAYKVPQFVPGAFIIRRLIGQVGFIEETEWQYSAGDEISGYESITPNPLDPSQPKRTQDKSGVAIRLFDARLDDGTRVLLKEYVGDSVSIGEREVSMYEFLYDRVVTQAGAGAYRQAAPPVQIGRLLGTMRPGRSFASPTFLAQWEASLPLVSPPSSDGFWLAFAWEAPYAVSNFPKANQERDLFDFDGSGAARTRAKFVKAIIKRSLETVAWLHGQGIVHRSLSGSSLVLNTFDQRTPPSMLKVSVVDLGYAATSLQLSDEDIKYAMRRGATSPLAAVPLFCRTEDLNGLGYVFMQLLFTSGTPAPDTPSFFRREEEKPANKVAPLTDMLSLRRLVEDIFNSDVVGEFREYCLEESEWRPAVSLLDESDKAGWRILQSLVECRDPRSGLAEEVSAASLLKSPWFDGLA